MRAAAAARSSRARNGAAPILVKISRASSSSPPAAGSDPRSDCPVEGAEGEIERRVDRAPGVEGARRRPSPPRRAALRGPRPLPPQSAVLPPSSGRERPACRSALRELARGRRATVLRAVWIARAAGLLIPDGSAASAADACRWAVSRSPVARCTSARARWSLARAVMSSLPSASRGRLQPLEGKGSVPAERRQHRFAELELGLAWTGQLPLAEGDQRRSGVVPLPQVDRSLRGVEQVHGLEVASAGSSRQFSRRRAAV